MIESEHRNFQKAWGKHKNLKRCDVLGTILILEYIVEKTSYDHPLKGYLVNFFKKQGILIRPLGNTLYLLPPYCINSKELQNIYACIVITLENLT